MSKNPLRHRCVLRFIRILFLGSILGTLLRPDTAGQTRATLEHSVRTYDELFQVLPPDQEDVLIGDMRFKKKFLQEWRDHLNARLKGEISAQGAFDFSSSKAWPSGKIPYRYDASVPDDVKTLFESAIREWQVHASLNFVPRTTEADYILVKFTGYADNAAMNSWIGVQGGAQDLNVAGWGNKIDCAHELGHALGMTHEQCRSDRDTYVTIISTNMTVDPRVNVNYAIVPSSINRTAYDFDSLMHYPRSAFAKSAGLVTLRVKSPNEKWSDGKGPEEIGQKTHLSTGDKAAMAGQYGSPLALGGRIVDAAGSALPGVQVTLSGGSTYRGENPITTDSDGRYSFTGIPRNSGSYTVTPSQAGTSFTVASRSVSITTSSQNSVNFTSVDAAPPDLVIEVPAVSGVYSSTPTASGTAKDAVGVREVRVALARTSDLVWWNWSKNSWGTRTFNWADNVRIANGTTTWSAGLPALAVGGYQTHVQSVDLSDNASPWRFRHFFVDPEPPKAAVTRPLHKATVPELTTIRGTATDGAGTGLSNNVVQFTMYQNGAFWTGIHWKDNTSAQDPEVLLSADVVAGQWAYNSLPEGANIRAGTYYISLFARDYAGNTSIPQAGVNSVEFTVDNSAPAVVITAPVDGSTVTNLSTITGKASDGKELQTVNLYLYRYSDNQFWDGTAWGGGGSAILPVSINPDGSWASTGPLPSSLSSNPATKLSNGGYNIMAFAVDGAGNQTRADVVFTVEYYPTYVWTAGSLSDSDPNNNNHNWSNPANWKPYGVPGIGDIAVIHSGSPTFYGDLQVRELQLNGGTLRGGTLLFEENGKMTWSGGTLSAHVTIQPGANLVVTGTNDKVVSSGIRLELNGDSTWEGTSSLQGSGGVVIRNNGTMTTAGTFSLRYYNNGVYPIGTVENFGTWNQTGAGSVGFEPDYGGWGLTNAGHLNIQEGSILLQNSTHLGGTISGQGKLVNRGGTLHLNDSVNLNGGTVELLSGTLRANGTFAGNGHFLWKAGTVAGSLTNGVSSTMKLTTTQEKILSSGALLVNQGYALWEGGTLHTSGNSRFHNTGTLETSGELTALYYNNGVSPRGELVNTGLVHKTGAGTVLFRSDYGGWHFHNRGETRVSAGTLRLGGGGNSSDCVFQIAPEATLELISGEAHNFSGLIKVNGGGRLINAGASVKGTEAQIQVAAGSVFEHFSGTTTGTLSIAGPGTLEWSGGTLNAAMTWDQSLQAILSGAKEKNLEGGKIHQQGAVVWTGTGLLRATGGSLIENHGIFEMQNDSAFLYYNNGVYPVGAFVNYGTFRKTVASGVTLFRDDYGGWRFINRGVLDIQSGILDLRVTATLENGGSFQGPGITRVSANTTTLEGTNRIGTGTIEVLSGRWNSLDGTLAGPGTFLWAGGSVSGSTVLALTNFVIAGTGDKQMTSPSTLKNYGLGRWTGSGALRMVGQSSLENFGRFETQNDAVVSYYNNGVYPKARFFNAGTFVKTGGTNETIFANDYGGPAFDNHGVIAVETGTLSLGGGGLWDRASVGVAEEAELKLFGGKFELTNSTTFLTGTTRIKGADLHLQSSTNQMNSPSSLRIESGSMSGVGALTGSGNLDWIGGTMSGNFDLGKDLRWNISGDGEKQFPIGTIANYGTATWTGNGSIRAQGGAALHNHGSFIMKNDSAFSFYNNGVSPRARFVNNGLMVKSDSSGFTTFADNYGGWDFLQNGTIRMESGVLRLLSGSYFTNAIIQGPGKVLAQTATLHLNGTTALDRSATFELGSGNMMGTNRFTGPGTFLWTGGEIRERHTVAPAGNMLLSGTGDKKLASFAVLVNEGETTWTGGRLYGHGASRFVNKGTLITGGDTSFFYYNNGISPGAEFSNSGMLRRETSGTTAFSQDYGGWKFSNSGTLHILGGILDVGPRYAPESSAHIHFLVGGGSPGVDYGQVIFRGSAEFTGSLQVSLTNNFIPTQTNLFTLATYPSYNGNFASAILPPLSSNERWKLNYTAKALQLNLVAPTAIQPDYGYSADGKFSLSVNGAPGQYAVLQSSTNLVDWMSIQTNQPFNGSFTFTDGLATNQNQFYRTLVVE